MMNQERKERASNWKRLEKGQLFFPEVEGFTGNQDDMSR